MKLRLLMSAAAAAGLLSACTMPASTGPVAVQAYPIASSNPGQDPMVGGAAMYPTKNIVQNAIDSPDHTTLVKAVQAAGLVDTLEQPGPFTVFAPTNDAFDMVAPATVAMLMKPQNKATLVKVLTYHVVPGRVDTAALSQMIAAGGGRATLVTVEGEPLTVTMSGTTFMVTDVKGHVATITVPDVYQSNGVINVIDHVLMP